MSLRKIVSTAAALAIMGTAAMAAPNASTKLGVDGTGDYLVFPIYFAQQSGNWKTNVKVVNTNTDHAVVAKVVVREGVSSSEKIDFVIYLSPGDVWEGELYADANNNVHIRSTDDSMIMGGRIATPENPIDYALYAPVNGQNNHFGYIEVYGMGSYPAANITDRDGDGDVWGGVGTPLDKDDLYDLYVKTLHANPNPDPQWKGVGVDDLYGVEVIEAVNQNGNLAMTLPAFALEGVTGEEANNNGVFGRNSTVANSIVTRTAADAATPGDVVNNIVNLLSKQAIYATYYDANGQAAETQLVLTQPFKFAYGFNSQDRFTYTATPRDQMEHTPQRTIEEVSGQVETVTPDSCDTEVCLINVSGDTPYASGYVTYSQFSNYYNDGVETNVPVPLIPTLMSAKIIGGKAVTNIFYPAYRK